MKAPMKRPVIRVFENHEALSRHTAALILELIADDVRNAGRCRVSLAGGKTPGRIYEFVAYDSLRRSFNWRPVQLFLGDERCVPPDQLRSNYWMTYAALISRVMIPPENVHRIRGELPPEEGAALYEQDLREAFEGEQLPVFDLMLLGLGEDAHTASLFPRSPALKEQTRWVAATTGDGQPRITLTLPVINRARRVFFVVTGRQKAEAVAAVLAGPRDPERLPAQLVNPAEGEVIWFIDRDASILIPEVLLEP